MIKYCFFDSQDEYGEHITPINNLYQMNKTASSYSPELMKIILNIKRQPNRYYVVVNALGSGEYWSANKNGDFFPEKDLSHKALRSDMGTDEGYGFLSFMYIGRFFRHHINKDPDKAFGEIVYAHWNPIIHRVELIVAINTETAKDIIDDIENGKNVSVSMGCKVKHDICSICNNKATTRAKYCKHVKNYMGQIVDKNLAEQWSKETGKKILPGTLVCVLNPRPKFFDLSKVFVGADNIAYILGKAASKNQIFYSTDIAESEGINDELFDKIAMAIKKGEINKTIPGSTESPDGKVIKINDTSEIRKSLDAKLNNTIVVEPQIPNTTLDSMATALPLESIFSTMMGLGIHPKPNEFQRIVLVRIGEKSLADDLEVNNTIFDTNDNSNPTPINLSNSDFSDTLGKALMPFLNERSCFPSMLSPRINITITKTAEQLPWNQTEKKEMKVNPAFIALSGLAALYAGLKLKALGYGPRDLASIFNKPWLRTLIGGSAMWALYNEIDKQKARVNYLPRAIDYANGLQNTNFSGHIVKESSLFNSLVLPSAYIFNSWNQKPILEKTSNLFKNDFNNTFNSGINNYNDSRITEKIKKVLKSV
jgi:hypothetical protein